MNTALKKAIEQLFNLCDISGASSVNGEIVNSEERETLKEECISFLSYLSSSDGTISEYEAEFISEYLGFRMSAEELRIYIEKHNTYTTEFEQRVPKTLERLISQDNQEHDEKRELALSRGEAFISVFECMGKEFLVCDGEADDQEVADFTTYTTTLRNYKKANARFPNKVKSAIPTDEIYPGQNIPKFNEKGEREETLDELINELNNLVGLQVVKNDVNSLIHLQEIKRL